MATSKIERQFVLTLTEEEARGLVSLLNEGVDWKTLQTLGIDDIGYTINTALPWFVRPTFAVKASIESVE